MKKCTKCGRELPLDRFNKKIFKSGNVGYRSECKDCQAARNACWRRNNIDKIKLEHARYYQNNKKDVISASAEWARNNPDKIRESRARWRKNNPGYGTMLRHNNLDKFRSLARATAKKRRANDSKFRVSVNIRRGMLRALLGESKAGHTEELLGCSIEYLRQYLEDQFKDDMSWDNYGRYGWHIDHIIPLSYFDLSDPEQQKRAWHYTNLQPLWARENIVKSNKIVEVQLMLI